MEIKRGAKQVQVEVLQPGDVFEHDKIVYLLTDAEAEPDGEQRLTVVLLPLGQLQRISPKTFVRPLPVATLVLGD